MLNVGTESGPYSNLIPVGAGLTLRDFGYAPGFGQTAVGQALSTGRAIMGVGGTAMGALQNLQNGIAQPLVVFDLTGPLR